MTKWPSWKLTYTQFSIWSTYWLVVIVCFTLSNILDRIWWCVSCFSCLTHKVLMVKVINLCIHPNDPWGSSCSTEDERSRQLQLLGYSVHVVLLRRENGRTVWHSPHHLHASSPHTAPWVVEKTTLCFWTKGTRYGTPPTSVMRGFPHRPTAWGQRWY